jgi:hypothetical protein
MEKIWLKKSEICLFEGAILKNDKGMEAHGAWRGHFGRRSVR